MADTVHLTTAEVGAYTKMLCAAWLQKDCSLPDNERQLQRIAGIKGAAWKQSKESLMEFWEASGEGRIIQKRLSLERQKLTSYGVQKSLAGKSSQAKRKALKDKEQTSTGVEQAFERNVNETSTMSEVISQNTYLSDSKAVVLESSKANGELNIPLKDGTYYYLKDDDINTLKDHYPNVDVPTELHRLVTWNTVNEDRRKTRRGIKRHITGWMAGEDRRPKDKPRRSGKMLPDELKLHNINLLRRRANLPELETL